MLFFWIKYENENTVSSKDVLVVRRLRDEVFWIEHLKTSLLIASWSCCANRDVHVQATSYHFESGRNRHQWPSYHQYCIEGWSQSSISICLQHTSARTSCNNLEWMWTDLDDHSEQSCFCCSEHGNNGSAQHDQVLSVKSLMRLNITEKNRIGHGWIATIFFINVWILYSQWLIRQWQ